MVALVFILLVALILFGVPVAFALAGAGFVGIWAVTGNASQAVAILGISTYSSVAEYLLSTVPLFILMAFFASYSGVARELFTAIANWTSGIRGGMAIATVGATGVFGAMSGASVAAASVMSEIAIPEMRKHGYADELSAGAVAVGATTDILIPPSVALVIYGLLTDTSLGALLIAGIVPGVMLAVILSLLIYGWVTVNPSIAPGTYIVPWRERFLSVGRIWPSIILIGGILVLLYSGIATPTEVGALGALLALIIAFALRRLSFAKVMTALEQTLRATAMIFLIFVGAKVFGYFLTLSQIPQHVVAAVLEMELNRWVVLVGIIVSYFVISMFMDEMPLMVITLPLTFPIVTSLGFDPVWFGIMTMMMVAMGLVFPPVGMVSFVVSAAGRVELTKVFKGASVLMMAIVITTILLMVFPQIALFLPATMR